MNFSAKLFIFFFIVSFPAIGFAGKVLNEDTVYSGDIVLTEDILVPEGVTLTVMPGTSLNVRPSDGTKTEPEYLSSLTEITVRGRLDIRGSKDSPVSIHIKAKKHSEKWAGIIVDGGSVNIRYCSVKDAETGIWVISGSATINDSVFHDNRYGLIAQSKTSYVKMTGSRITENDYGVFELDNAHVTYKEDFIGKNRKKDLYLYGSDVNSSILTGIKNSGQMVIHKMDNTLCRKTTDDLSGYKPEQVNTSKEYKDHVLMQDTVWSGRIVIDGVIRVPKDIRLIIVPGTVVEFRKKDTNGDGIGENGLMMQGVLIAKGTEEEPIIFRSAEKQRSMGDWDAINIINSDGAGNLIEFCRIENAYRGVHFHFSNVLVHKTVIKNNYRAAQFQDSTVEMRENHIFGNKSGIMARDSEVVFNNNHVFNNINGISFFRVSLTARGNNIFNNSNEGLKIREGTVMTQENLLDCNKTGLTIKNTFFGTFNRNVISNNILSGILLKDSDNIGLSANFIQGNGFNGISIMNSGAVIKENLISENGERGIGIQSFTGTITGNNITRNRHYAIGNDSAVDIPAPMNWWGGGRIDEVMYDKFDDPEKGTVIFSPAMNEPAAYQWPLKTFSADIKWHDTILVQDNVTVLNSVLRIAPGTTVLFSKDAGLKIIGNRIIAVGKEARKIVFTISEKNADDLWDEVLLEHANGSVFSYCYFEYAKWALHSHFSDLKVTDSRFKNNMGGMRFRSGPVEISGSSFSENRIGIRAFRANALITGNSIKNNETGIFVREKGGGLTIRNNDIYSNTGYNIRVGDFNMEDVDAKENWWGSNDPAGTIFDGRKEPGVGRVIYDPYVKEKMVIKEAEQVKEK